MTTREDQGERVNPNIGFIPKVIPLKLFLDMVLLARCVNSPSKDKMAENMVKSRVKAIKEGLP